MELASLAQLDRSHRRHDEVMAGLLAAARRLAAGRPEPSDVATVRDAVDYFARAVTRHFRDEEGSVFPRLSTRRPELAETLAALSSEHPLQIALHQAITDAARQLDDGRPNGGKSVLELAEKLNEIHRAHVEKEDQIFAAARDAFTAEDDAEMTTEMETRRDQDGHRRRREPEKKEKKKIAAKTKRAPKQKPKKQPKAKAKARAKAKAQTKRRR